VSGVSGWLGGARRRSAAAWRRLTTAWNRFWFREVDGLPLGLARIGFALAALFLWLETVPLLRPYYSDAGEFPIEGARSWGPEYVSRFLMPDVLGSLEAVVVLFTLLLACLVGLLVGYRTRLAAWGAWLLLVWFQYRNPTFLNGGDEVLRLTGLYLALDRRRTPEGGAGRGARSRVPSWTLRMMQIQVGLLYFVTGFWKLQGETWWDGRAMVYALDNAAFTRFGLPSWSWLQPLLAAAGLVVVFWEFLFPLLVAGRRTRIPALVVGVLFHCGIFLTMNIGVFAFAVLATYPVFLKAEELRAAGRWLGRRAPGWIPIGAGTAG